MKRFLSLTLALMMLITSVCVVNFSAFAASSATYTKVKVDASKTYYTKKGDPFEAKVYYNKIVLDGDSEVINKINSSIDKDCQEMINSNLAKQIYENAKEAVKYQKDYNGMYRTDDGTVPYFWYYSDSKVTYDKKGIISIKVTSSWCGGGVSNSFEYGLTYSLKTGEKLKLNDVCKGSNSAIKKRIVAKAKKDKEVKSDGIKTIKKKKVSKMDYYINAKNQAVVCFGPYEISYGGWARTYAIARK